VNDRTKLYVISAPTAKLTIVFLLSQKDPAMTQETPEARTRREQITPALIAAGWHQSPHFYSEEEPVTAGRLIPLGRRVKRREGLKADYVLRYNRDFKIAVVEAKRQGVPAENGVQQAKNYAALLGVKFAYATNGTDIIEIDYTFPPIFPHFEQFLTN
jgi:type I restriction enzyme R subunit